MAMKIAPLKGSFMALAIIGFLVSAFWVIPINMTWGLTMLIFFSTMFIAAFISMTYSPIAETPANKKK